MSKKIVVIGAGSGGLTSAIGLAKIGYEVILVEAHKIGGDCTHYGCIPSKTLIKESQKISEFVKEFGSELKLTKTEILDLSKKSFDSVRDKVDQFAAHESRDWLEKNGVKLIMGYAKFSSPNSLIIRGSNLENSSKEFLKDIKQDLEGVFEIRVSFDYCVIATGSSPNLPPIKNIFDFPVLTNKTIFDLKKAPKSLAVVGSGAIGVEMAGAFANFGTEVLLLSRSGHILKELDAEVSENLKKYLAEKGIKFYDVSASQLHYKNSEGFEIKLQDGSKINSQEVLIAAGRKPNVDLDLQEAGVDFSKAGIFTNKKMQTSNPKIYAVGDVVSFAPKFTHFADYMGSELVKNFALKKYLKFPFDLFSFDESRNPAVIYGDYELASFGLNEEEAKNKFGVKRVKVYNLGGDSFDRLKVGSFDHSIIKLVTLGIRRRVVGAQILNPRAGEMLPEFQNLVENKKSLLSVSKIIRAYPSYSFGYKNFAKMILFDFLSIFSKKTSR